MVYKKAHAFKILTAVFCAVLSLSVFMRCGVNAEASEVRTLDDLGLFSLTSTATDGFWVQTSAGTYLESENMTFFDFSSEFEAVTYNTYYMDSSFRTYAGDGLMLHGTYDFSYSISRTGGDPFPSGAVSSVIYPRVEHISHYLIVDNTEYFIGLGAVGSNDFWLTIESLPMSSYFQIKTVVSGSVSFNVSCRGIWTGCLSSPYFTVSVQDTWTEMTVYPYVNDAGVILENVQTLRSETAVNAQTQQSLTQQQTAQQHTDAQTSQQLTQQQTQQQHQDAQDALTEQQKQTEIQEEQKETTKGIFSKITDFFGSFFDKLSELVMHLVVPTSDELMTFLNEVNTWFGERLGFIYYPFDLAVRIVSAFAGGSADTSITVPALSLNLMGSQYTIWGAFTVNLDEFGIFVYVRYFTSALLCLGVGKLAVSKWDDWIGGKKT